jgi:phosphatidylglycerophosphatase A
LTTLPESAEPVAAVVVDAKPLSVLLPPIGESPYSTAPPRAGFRQHLHNAQLARSEGASADPSKPSSRFMLRHPAHAIALGMGTGLSPFAPGTAATLWAWVAFLVLNPFFDDSMWAITIGVGFLVGWWASTVTANKLGQSDPGCIVIDEIIAFWLVLWLVMPAGIWGQIAAFALFRYFDAAKPGPVGWADRAFKGSGWRGGFGVMVDDVVAAGCALLVLAAWRFIF